MGGALLACSDGVWDHLSAEEAASVLLAGKYSDGKSAAMQVVKAAISKTGITDDTTACVILFGPPTVSPDISKEGSKDSFNPQEEEAVTLDERLVRADDDERVRHGSFLRRVSSHRGSSTDASDVMDDSTADNVAPELCSYPHSERGIHGSSPAPMRAPPDASVKGGKHFSRVGFEAQPTGHDDDEPPSEAASDRIGRPPPAWAMGLPEKPGGGADRQSVRLPGSTNFARVQEPRAGSPTRKDPSSPGFLRQRNNKRASLSRLFDHVVGGDGASKRWTDEMDSSKQSESMDNSKCGDMDSSKDGSFSEKSAVFSPWKSSSPPWQGVPSHVRRVVNADPSSAWRPESKLGGPSSAGQRGFGGGSLRVREEETQLRSSLTVGSTLPAAARTVDWTSLDLDMEFLGQGEFATAHRTVLDGTHVAVKMLKKSKQELPSALQGIKREIMLMSLMKHPNVLPARALGQYEGKPFIIIELLASVLHKELPRDVDTVPFWVRWREVKAWPLSRALNCGVQLARALKYCHDDAFPGYRILHRDVKPNNIGFLTNGDLVLFDFGLASLWQLKGNSSDDAPHKLTGETGSMRYMAPEVANSQRYNHKAEVFSFASVQWELCAHKKPFLEYSAPELFKAAVIKGVHPKLSPKWPAKLNALLEGCWKLDQAARPELRDVVPRLERLLSDTVAVEAATKKKPPAKPPLGWISESMLAQRAALLDDAVDGPLAA